MIVRNNRMKKYPLFKNSTALAALAFIFSITGLAIPNIILYIIGVILLLMAFNVEANKWKNL